MVATQASRDKNANTMALEYVLFFMRCKSAFCSTLSKLVDDLRASWRIVNLVALLCQKIGWKAELYVYGSACCATLAYKYYKYIAVAYLIQKYTNTIYMYMLTVYAVNDVLCRPHCFQCIVSFVKLGFVAACKALCIYTCRVCAHYALVR